ncbi:MAG: mandelate racemase/muconate lactonizing enzyme family protein [Deltaproteobacteria bacterium]|nr:mandelate racemase/muconate lactonizing enzyme family protein [Deltaproteobacteria bacterium]
MSRIARVSIVEESLPLGLDLGSQYARIDSLGYVLVGLIDESGRTGVGWTFAIDLGEASRIAKALRERAPLLVGLDPVESDANWDRLRAASTGLERAVGSPAVSAFDVALWDLRGRQAQSPVHRLLGARADRLRTYASDALWASLPPDVLAANAAAFVAEGFGAIKIRSGGSKEPAREAERVRAVRAAVGDATLVLYDALQGYDVESAIALGRALEREGVGWLEDPVPETDLAGLARVRAALDLPIASGEDATWPEGCEAFLERDAVDVLMVDPKWVGGITPWLRVARAAERRGVRMVSHISPELSAPVLAAHAPEALLEWFSWSFGLYATPPTLVRGVYRLSDEPGFGLVYRGDLLDRLFG